jgi:hypothetical protein
MAQLVADSVAQAIVEDFMIFEMFPKALKYGSEITIELIKSKPIEQVGELVKGVGKMQESQGKAVQYASKGLYPWKDLL